MKLKVKVSNTETRKKGAMANTRKRKCLRLEENCADREEIGVIEENIIARTENHVTLKSLITLHSVWE